MHIWALFVHCTPALRFLVLRLTHSDLCIPGMFSQSEGPKVGSRSFPERCQDGQKHLEILAKVHDVRSSS